MSAQVFDRERRVLTIGILLAIAAFAVEGMGVVPALPTAVNELGGMRLFGWAFSAFMLAWLVGTVVGGLWADARGPRQPMAAGLGAFGAGLLLAGSAHGIMQFLGGRALQGAGGGAVIASAYVAIARGYPDAIRPRMMALTASTWILPAIGGPALSGAVTQWIGWRYVFAGVVPMLVITAAVLLPQLRRFDVHAAVAGGGRVVAALCASAGCGLLIASSGAHWIGIAIGAAGFVLLVPALRRLLPPGTLRARTGLAAGIATRSLLAFSYFGAEAYVLLGSGQLRGATPVRAGLALSAAALGWIASSWVQDRMEARGGASGRVRRMRLGFTLLTSGIVLVAIALLTSLPAWLVPLGWAVGGAGIGFAYTAGSLICIAQAPAGREGEVSGQLQLAEALGTAAGTGFGGALLAGLESTGGTPRQAHAAVFAMTLLVGLLGLTISGRNRSPDSTA